MCVCCCGIVCYGGVGRLGNFKEPKQNLIKITEPTQCNENYIRIFKQFI